MNQQLFNDIAAHLGGVFVPIQWRCDEPASDDSGSIYFGDPTDWRTPAIWLHIGGYRMEGKIKATAGGNILFISDKGTTRQHNCRTAYSFEATQSVDKGADKIAKDLKRRILDPMLAVHPASIATIEAAIAKEDDKKAWLKTFGLESERGDMWRGKNNAYANLESCTDSGVCMNLRWLSRAQAEAVIRTLKETT